MSREKLDSGTVWEPMVGYSRAVRVGPHIHVSGTTATNGSGQIVGIDDPAAQMRQCVINIEAALAHFGASLADVVRTRIYVKDIESWQAIGDVHRRYFSETRPATSMIEVSRFIAPEILVEIEADAYCEGSDEAERP